jgi:hypothetical protein
VNVQKSWAKSDLNVLNSAGNFALGLIFKGPEPNLSSRRAEKVVEVTSGREGIRGTDSMPPAFSSSPDMAS